jgi:uncharacterized membrane protein
MSSAAIETQDKQSRPFGVYVVILIMLLQLVASVTDLWATNFLKLPSIGLANLDNQLIAFIIHSSIAVAIIAVVIGLWRLKRWAWYATMILFGIFLMWNISLYFEQDPTYLNLLAGIIAVFYLNLREVQAAFGTDVGGF